MLKYVGLFSPPISSPSERAEGEVKFTIQTKNKKISLPTK